MKTKKTKIYEYVNSLSARNYPKWKQPFQAHALPSNVVKH